MSISSDSSEQFIHSKHECWRHTSVLTKECSLSHGNELNSSQKSMGYHIHTTRSSSFSGQLTFITSLRFLMKEQVRRSYACMQRLPVHPIESIPLRPVCLYCAVHYDYYSLQNQSIILASSHSSLNSAT